MPQNWSNPSKCCTGKWVKKKKKVAWIKESQPILVYTKSSHSKLHKVCVTVLCGACKMTKFARTNVKKGDCWLTTALIFGMHVYSPWCNNKIITSGQSVQPTQHFFYTKQKRQCRKNNVWYLALLACVCLSFSVST